MAPKYKHIHFVSFQSLVNWSVAHLLNKELGFTKQYPFVSIGDLIHRSSELVNVEDDILYTQVTLKTNGGGAVLRDKKFGKDIGTKKQYRAKEGQFIMSKIDARNGAFGVVGKELDGAIVTGDFPLFDVDKDRINPFYLYLLSSTRPFVQFAQSCSRGTTNRQRIDIDAFLGMQIPLPSLDEQNEIVAAYNDSFVIAKQYEKQASDKEDSIQQYLDTQLGIEQLTSYKLNQDSILQFIKFKDTFYRWDPWRGDNIISSKYKIVRLQDILQQINTGTTPPTNRPEYFGGDIKFYTPSDIDGNMYLGESERTLSQKAIADKKARIFRKGDLLFVGTGSTVGKVGVINDDIVSSNQQITGLTLDLQTILPEYAFVYMNANKDITTAEQSKTTLPIVNQEKIKNIQIPLPPIDVQKEIVAHVFELKEQIKSLRALAADTRATAIQQFEQTIFE